MYIYIASWSPLCISQSSSYPQITRMTPYFKEIPKTLLGCVTKKKKKTLKNSWENYPFFNAETLWSHLIWPKTSKHLILSLAARKKKKKDEYGWKLWRVVFKTGPRKNTLTIWNVGTSETAHLVPAHDLISLIGMKRSGPCGHWKLPASNTPDHPLFLDRIFWHWKLRRKHEFPAIPSDPFRNLLKTCSLLPP